MLLVMMGSVPTMDAAYILQFCHGTERLVLVHYTILLIPDFLNCISKAIMYWYNFVLNMIVRNKSCGAHVFGYNVLLKM